MAMTALKHVTRFEYGDALALEARNEGAVPVFGSNGVTGVHDAPNTLGPAIIVGRKGSFGKVTWTELPGFCIDTAYYIDSRSTRANLRWLYWALQTLGLDQHSEDTGVPGLSREKAYQEKLRFPKPCQQERIANFLDEKTARIDALIAEKELLLDRLSELNSSRLEFELAGGAKADKPTHYEWYQKIPKSWKVMPFKLAVNFVEGPGILANDFREEGIPLLRVSSVRGDVASLEGCNYLDPEKVSKTWSQFQVKRGDLLISASASMGTVSLVTEDVEGAVPYTGIIILRPVKGVITRELIRHFVVSPQFSRQIDLLKAGATIQHFGPTHLKQVVIAIPDSLDEQVALTNRLDQWKSEQASLAGHVCQHITRLREYRSSLISAAVTGQLNIDDFQARQLETA